MLIIIKFFWIFPEFETTCKILNLNSMGKNIIITLVMHKKRLIYTREEDQIIVDHVRENGEQKWNECAKKLANRNEKSCRERWVNYLNPTINNTPWIEDGDRKLIELANHHKNVFGKINWATIKTFFDRRTDINCKNRYCTLKNQKKKAEKNESKISAICDPSQSAVSEIPKHDPTLNDQYYVEFLTFEPVET